MRVLLPVLGVLALAACEPEPIYTAGVGFDDYSSLEAGRAEREAELRGGATTLALPPASGPIGAGELAAAGLPVASGRLAPGSEAAGQPAGGGAFGAAAAPLDSSGTFATVPSAGVDPVAPAQVANPGDSTISDEQSFDAVSNRETIESDAARLAAQREAYQVIQPQALPSRPADTGPNIVAYALQTSNRVGERIYTRSGVNLGFGRRSCNTYPSPDKAQEAFLEAGGPRRDRYGLDPDGDGFACGWDPAPFRTVRSN